MRTDPRGIVYALRRAVREKNRGLEDLLSEEIIEHLVRLDAIEARTPIHESEVAPSQSQEMSNPPRAPGASRNEEKQENA